MNKTSKKLLALILSLLLGLLPVQGAFAGISKISEDEAPAVSFSHGMAMAAMTDSHAAMTDCKECATDGGCLCVGDHACKAGGCATCTMMVQQHLDIAIVLTPLGISNRSPSENIPRSSPSSLFRPPIF